MDVLAQHHRLAACDIRAYYNTCHAYSKARDELSSVLVDNGVPEEGLIPLENAFPHLPKWMRKAPERNVWALGELENIFPSNQTSVALSTKITKMKAPFITSMIQSIIDAGYERALSIPASCEQTDKALKLAGLYDVYMDLRMQEESSYITSKYSIMNKLGISANVSDKAIYATGAGVLGAITLGVGWFMIKKTRNQGSLNRLADDILMAESKKLRSGR